MSAQDAAVHTPHTSSSFTAQRPVLHRKKDLAHRTGVSFTREIAASWLGMGVTLLATLFFFADMAGPVSASLANGALGTWAVQAGFVAIFTFLIYGNFLYQLCRVGYFARLKRNRPAETAVLEEPWRDESAPLVSMLIPSYKEELGVIRQSILSCALQEYPRRRVTLLIDNPPEPEDGADRVLLEKTRRLVLVLRADLEVERRTYQAAYAEFRSRRPPGDCSSAPEFALLQEYQLRAARWFSDRAARETCDSHTDALFVELTFRLRAEKEFERAGRLAREILELPEEGRADLFDREYARLASMFDANISSFERKRYVNLSHESNKAMNLNSYLGLMGKHFRTADHEEGRALLPCDPWEAELSIPHADFVLTLDADSLLDFEYALRLTEIMRRPGNERIGVVQTPYTAVPGAPGALERTAGATTDMQYIIHQGFTQWGATFWVGANALIRRAALEDIAADGVERGFPIRRYIQDRTVIEDTESSVDLVSRGWTLHNHPERLSYSATPPDFGSLLIQRRRWANGGLIILPKLLRYLAERVFRPSAWGEGFFRFHYLVSIAAVNLGLLAILAYPFDRPLRIAWLPLTALPYYVLYGRDMMLSGYRLTDVFRVYALNLLLIPVNLGGVLKSVWQIVTKRKIPFSRTPKVQGLTLAPTHYAVYELILCGYCYFGAAMDAFHGRWLHAAFAVLNALILSYALGALFDFKANTAQMAEAFRRRGGSRAPAAIPGLESGNRRGNREVAVPARPGFEEIQEVGS